MSIQQQRDAAILQEFEESVPGYGGSSSRPRWTEFVSLVMGVARAIRLDDTKKVQQKVTSIPPIILPYRHPAVLKACIRLSSAATTSSMAYIERTRRT